MAVFKKIKITNCQRTQIFYPKVNDRMQQLALLICMFAQDGKYFYSNSDSKCNAVCDAFA